MALVTLAAGAALLGWLAGRQPRASGAEVAVVALALVLLGRFGVGLIRLPVSQLAWDGQAWTHRYPDVSTAPWRLGHVAVAIDLGGWMLLRFRRDAGTARAAAATVWLPVQRRGLERHWHLLRCAVHARGARLPGDGPSSHHR